MYIKSNSFPSPSSITLACSFIIKYVLVLKIAIYSSCEDSSMFVSSIIAVETLSNLLIECDHIVCGHSMFPFCYRIFIYLKIKLLQKLKHLTVVYQEMAAINYH